MKFPIVRKKAIPAVKRPPAPGQPGRKSGRDSGESSAKTASSPRRRSSALLDAPVREVEMHPARLEPGAADVRQRLLRSGLSASLADRVVRRVMLSGARGAFAIDAAAEVIGRCFPVRKSPKLSQGPHQLVFVGPTGGGKTATLAKLGRALVENKRKVLFASLDSIGASALETVGGVGADVDRSEIPLVVLRRATDLRRVLRRSPKVEAVLIDTPGISPRDDAELNLLAAELSRIESKGSTEIYLVLPAGASRSSLELTVRAFSRMAPTAAVITKLDETSEPGTAVEIALRAHLPLAFLCDGQDVRAHVMRPTPDRLADLMLRGKLI
jgi:flagellar biosynthesis protein FlhF